MKVKDLIKRTMTYAFITFGVYGLINGANPIFYAIFTLLSVGSLILSLNHKDDTDDSKNDTDSWDAIRAKEKENEK